MAHDSRLVASRTRSVATIHQMSPSIRPKEQHILAALELSISLANDFHLNHSCKDLSSPYLYTAVHVYGDDPTK